MSKIKIMDCTLRDGANVVGKGFSADATKMIIEGLIKSNVKIIEMGHALGLGAYDPVKSLAPCTDKEYFDLVQPYLNQADIGMFIGARNTTEENISSAAQNSLKFLRVGANAGDGETALEGIKRIKKYGMQCRYAIMKAYVLGSDQLVEEAKILEACGLDEITIMDSAGTMTPDDVEDITIRLVKNLAIPVAFHGHNNLGLATANSMAAARSGAQVIDCGLMGMARSAGNCATEVAVAVFQRAGISTGVDFYTLLDFIDNELIPAMNLFSYKAPITPQDLVYGLSGCHSNFAPIFETIAAEKGVSLYKLITNVSAIDKKSPPKELIEKVADELLKLK